MTTMTADQFRDFPAPDHAHARTQHPGRPRTGTERLQDAGIIFGGITVALAGIFGILELSSRNASDGTNAIITRLETLQYSQVELNDRIARLETGFDQRFNKVDDRLDKIDERFEGLETKMDERFQKVDERFERLETKFNERFVKLEAKFDRKFERIDERFERTDEKYDRMSDILLQYVEQKIAPANAAVKTGSPGKAPSR